MNYPFEQKLILDISKYKSIKDTEETLLRNVDFEKVNWWALFDYAGRHKLFPLCYSILEKYIPDDRKDPFEFQYYSALRKKKWLVSDLQELVHNARIHGIDMLVMKGPGLSMMLYDEPFIRSYGDIDILIKESDFNAIDKIMKNIGYYPRVFGNSGRRTPIPIFNDPASQDIKYKKFDLDRDLNGTFEIKRHIWPISSNFSNEYFNNLQKLYLNNTSIPVLDIQYTFLVLCSYAYNYTESSYGVFAKNCLRDYSEIYTYIHKYTINWNEFSLLANKLGVLHKIYLVFNNLNTIYGDVIDNEIIEKFNPKNATYEVDAYEDGSFFNWKSNIITRLFDDRRRLHEYKHVLKEFKFSGRNKHFSNPLGIKHHDLLLDNLELYNSFIDQKYNLVSKYLFSYDNENLYFFLNMNEYFLLSLDEQFVFSLSLQGVNNGGDVTTRTYSIIKVNNEIICVSEGLFNGLSRERKKTDIDLDGTKLDCIVNQKNTIKVTIPIMNLNFNLSSSHNKIGYNMTIYENINNYDIWIASSRRFLNDETGVVVVKESDENSY